MAEVANLVFVSLFLTMPKRFLKRFKSCIPDMFGKIEKKIIVQLVVNSL